VASGELLYQVLREPGMPTPQSVCRWANEKADFGAELMAARRAGGRAVSPNGRGRGGGGVWTYCEATAREVFERLVEGESLTSICKDPTMPAMSTIWYWRRAIPEFNATIGVGKEIQAEQLADEGWEMAKAATSEEAYLTHVRLTHLRWMTGVMAPRHFRVKPVEPPVVEEPLRILFRHFEVEVDPQTGKRRVVALCPNPDTGEVEREDTPGYEFPPNSQPMPAGAHWAKGPS
jgi:hypothetical protein